MNTTMQLPHITSFTMPDDGSWTVYSCFWTMTGIIWYNNNTWEII